MNELIYLNDEFDDTVERILSDSELANCGLGKRKISKVLKSFQGDEIACSVFLKKYALRDEDDKIIELTLDEAKDRWAKEMVNAEMSFNNGTSTDHFIKYFKELYEYLLPAGRQMFALGNHFVPNTTLSNCYVTGIDDDSIEGIFDAAKKMAKTYSYGGGVGLCIGKLRPSKSKVSNSARVSTGAVSFMELYSMTTGLIGQCVARGERVLTSTGLKPIENISIGEEVWTKEGFRKVSRTFANGMKKIYKITDEFGFQIRVSEDHILTTEEDGILKETPLKDLSVGDPIVLIPGTPIEKEYVDLISHTYKKCNFSNKSNRLNEGVELPLKLNEKLAYILGYSYGDGCVGYDKFNDPCVLSLSCSNDWPEVKVQLDTLIQDIFKYSPHFKEGDGDLQILYVHSKIILNWLKTNELLKQKAGNLIMPKKILESPTSVQMAFISGFFDADGKKINGKCGYAISVIDFEFLQQIKILLMSAGIPSKNNFEYRENVGWNNLHGITIAGTSAQTMAKEMLNMSVKVRTANFVSKRDSYLTPFKSRTFDVKHNNYNYCPSNGYYLSCECFNRLKKEGLGDKFPEMLIKSSIQTIEEELDLQPTFDIEVEGDENLYFCEGFRIHNSGRRGALLLSIPVNHPDVEQFIEMKHNNTDMVRYANISIKITDEFMDAVVNDVEFELSFETPHERIFRKIRARDLWNKIITSAYDSAEPGILFFDTARKMSPSDVYPGMEIQTTNPCITGDSLIYVADGRGHVPIKKLAEEGKDIPVFCLDNNQKITIRTMRNPRVTGYNMPTYKITFDDGNFVKTTANHEFLLKNGQYKKAIDLALGDSLKIITQFEASVGEVLRKENKNLLDQGYNCEIVEGKVFVIKNCEICKKEFKIHHSRREVGMCSKKCHMKFLKERNRNSTIKDTQFAELKEAASQYNHKIVSVEFIGNEDVYNGTVDEFHNFCWGAFKNVTKSGKNKFFHIVSPQCGEIWLETGSACVLASLLLHKFVINPYTENARFDFELFKEMTKRGVRHLDNIVELNLLRHALPEQTDAAQRGRRIGLGVTGLADTLAALGIRYDSQESLKLSEQIFYNKMEAEYLASAELAQDRGSFPAFDSKKHFERGFCRNLPEEVKSLCKKGLRNVTLSTVAPSGSLSIIAQCSSGMEPIFSLNYKRYVELGGDRKEFNIFHPGVKRFLNETAHEGLLPPYWVVAHDIDYNFRIKMQGIIQKFVDSSISSTINLPKSIDKEVVSQIYIDAWKEGLKGITVYREGSREGVLVTDEYAKGANVPKLDTSIHCVRAEGGDKFYTIISYKDGNIKKPYQVFVMNYKQAEKDAFVKIGNSLVRMLKENGVSDERIEKYISRSQNSLAKLTRFLSLSMKTDNLEKAVDILNEHAFAGTLAAKLYEILHKSLQAQKEICQNKNCKGSNIKMEEGCMVCLDCGWSGCT